QIDVDIVRLEVPQALLNRDHEALSAAVTPVGSLGVANTEFGHNRDLLPARPKGPCERLLRRAHPIGFRSVKAVDASVYGPLPRLLKLHFVDLAIGPAHLPAAKTHGRDLQVCSPKWSIFHTLPLRHTAVASGLSQICQHRKTPPNWRGCCARLIG